MIHYLSEKTLEDYDSGLFEHGENPAISPMARAKEILVAKTLRDLTAPNVKYSVTKVLECIRALQADNKRIHEKHGVSFGLFSLPLSNGSLDTHVENAARQIMEKHSEELLSAMSNSSLH